VLTALGLEPQLKGTLVYGALCLVESEWGLLDRPFQIGDAVHYPGALRKRLKRKGALTVDRMKLAADVLDRALPPVPIRGGS
jgi:hypothetical protein